MPPSIHSILIHGYLIVEAVVLPIGMFSEEAQECKNKDIKRYRESVTAEKHQGTRVKLTSIYY